MNEELLENLTEPQRQAVLHQDGPLLVVAGPGSGKTRVVTHRVAHLLHTGVHPDEILVLTFTNKAADEMKTRVERLTNSAHVWIGTFHRFCARLLRQYADRAGLDANYTIYDTKDSVAAVRSAIARLKEMDAEKDGLYLDAKYSAESIMHAVSALKNRYLNPEQEFVPAPDDERGVFVKSLLPVFAHEMRLANAVDFDDLLLLTVRLLRENPALRRQLDAQFRYILVDEYQDTNLAQYAISRALSHDTPNLMVTGDPDQSIYGWRGADITNILEFEHDFPTAKVIHLEENFRSTQWILNAAERLIEHNVQRKPKALFSRLGNGIPVRFHADADEEAEAERIASEIADSVRNGVRVPEDFAIFYRMNALSVHFEKALRLAGIPFKILHGTEFFERTEIRDLLAYLRLLANPHDNEAFERVVNVPTRGIGKTSLDHLRRFAWVNGFSLWEASVHAAECSDLKTRAVAAITAFKDLILQLYEQYSTLRQTGSSAVLAQLARSTVSASQYEAQFDPDDEQDAQHLRNIAEFVSLAARFEEKNPGAALEAFLEQNSLVSETDDLSLEGLGKEFQTDRNSQNAVLLMTLHAAKGLEFPCVYLTGCEHGILPHERAFEDENELEEERRLMFVGMTRAKEELNLSMAQSRETMGKRKTSAPSAFLMELPREEMLLENLQFQMDFDAISTENEPLDASFCDSPAEMIFEDSGEIEKKRNIEKIHKKEQKEKKSEETTEEEIAEIAEVAAKETEEKKVKKDEKSEDSASAEDFEWDSGTFPPPNSAVSPSRSAAPRSEERKTSDSQGGKSQSGKEDSAQKTNRQVLQKFSNIPGVMTGAELLRKQKENDDSF